MTAETPRRFETVEARDAIRFSSRFQERVETAREVYVGAPVAPAEHANVSLEMSLDDFLINPNLPQPLSTESFDKAVEGRRQHLLELAQTCVFEIYRIAHNDARFSEETFPGAPEKCDIRRGVSIAYKRSRQDPLIEIDVEEWRYGIFDSFVSTPGSMITEGDLLVVEDVLRPYFRGYLDCLFDDFKKYKKYQEEAQQPQASVIGRVLAHFR